MKRVFLTVSVTLVALGGVPSEPTSSAEPAAKEPPKLAATTTRVKCSICPGKGSLKVRPPDVGQFTGRIESRSHWDVNLDPCPVCGQGHGWRTVWDLTQPEPKTEAPCTKCGWSGLVQCRKCLAAGVADCPRSDCRDGWIIEERPGGSRRKSARKPPSVKPCPECKGVGKVVCPVCKGMRAELCNRCFGTGRNRR